jgi:hypothetical protein
MRLRARRHGTSTDTSCDHEYTDWEALDRFVDEFIEQSVESSGPPSSEPSNPLTFLG